MYACLQKYNDKIKAGQTRLILNSRFGLPLGVQTTSFLVAGFYSLSMAESQLENLPTATRKKLPPQYPVPVARLSRLAVDKTCQGQRMGEILLMNALARCARIAGEIGTVGIIVDAKHEQAQRFYLKYGFTPYTTKPLTLFIPMQTVMQSLP